MKDEGEGGRKEMETEDSCVVTIPKCFNLLAYLLFRFNFKTSFFFCKTFSRLQFIF